MADPKLVRVVVELPEAQAYALGELAKRACFSDLLSLSVGHDEAVAMVHALDRLRSALAASGVSVR